MSSDDATDRDPRQWLTKSEAAEYLAVSPRTLQRHVTGGKLPHYRVGRSLRFRRSELDEYIASWGRAQELRSAHGGLAGAEAAVPSSWTNEPVQPSEADLLALGRQAQAAGIRRIFKSRIMDPAYTVEFAAAFDEEVESGEVRIMSNSLRFIFGPQPDLGLLLPMWNALRRGVRFRLLLLDPFSVAARARAEVEERASFAGDDVAYYESHRYRDALAVVQTLASPAPMAVVDESLRARITDRRQVAVRFSSLEPTTHLVLAGDRCFVETYHTGGNRAIEDQLMHIGIPRLHCFGGFSAVWLFSAASTTGELLGSHFDNSWDRAAGGPTLEAVLEHDRARARRGGSTG